MSDPTRWTEPTSGAEPLEQELILAGQRDTLSPSEHRELWTRIASACASTGAASAAAASSRAQGTAATKLGILSKALVVLGTGGGLAALGYLSVESSAPAGSASATRGGPVVAAATASIPTVASPSVATASAAAGAPEPTPPRREELPGSAAVEASSRASLLREERRAILTARSRLRAGDAAGALQLLERARQRYPRGALVQEREALTIQALEESGETDAARARGREFLRTYPRSPHAADVRARTGR